VTCFTNRVPSLELLLLAKEYAKGQHTYPDHPLPSRIATMLYYTCIIVALVRLQQRITRLDDAAMTHGFDWALRQDCLDDSLRAPFQDGLAITNDGSG
jgi:hypothetical protein